MAHLRKMLCFAFIGLICLGRSGFVIAEDNDGVSIKFFCLMDYINLHMHPHPDLKTKHSLSLTTGLIIKSFG